MSKRDLWEFHECHEAVTRSGIDQPCDRTAVALRIDPEEGHPYPVCARHARNGGSRMVPLADVVRPVVEERNRVAAARDAAVARAEQAEAEVKDLRAYRLVMAVFGVPKDAPQPFALLGDDNKPFALGVQWPGGAVTVKSTPPERLGNVTSASLDDYFTQYGTSPIVWLSEDLGTLAEHEERAIAAEQAVAEQIAQAIEARAKDGTWNVGGQVVLEIAAGIARERVKAQP